MENERKESSIDQFMSHYSYNITIYPNESCDKCSFFFLFDNTTRCYAYEQNRLNDKHIVFHPEKNCDCSLFTKDRIHLNEISFYVRALEKGIVPETDYDYLDALNDADEYISAIINDENSGFIDTTDDFEECDDPNTYAHCSDWEDEPDNCYSCADDECPLNKG